MRETKLEECHNKGVYLLFFTLMLSTSGRFVGIIAIPVISQYIPISISNRFLKKQQVLQKLHLFSLKTTDAICTGQKIIHDVFHLRFKGIPFSH